MKIDEIPDGGGCGGGPDGPARESTYNGSYAVTAGEISFLARIALPPAVPTRPVVSILAGDLIPDGHVEIRGGMGVRITGGPPPGLPAGSGTTNGVEVAAGPIGTISLKRGLLPVDQKVELTPAGITINAGSMPVKIESLSEITLSVAGGLSKIRIGPEGITIEGPIVRISGTALTEVKGTMTTVQATAINKISGALTMIG